MDRNEPMYFIYGSLLLTPPPPPTVSVKFLIPPSISDDIQLQLEL